MAPTTSRQALLAWLRGFADCVRELAFDRAKGYFHPTAYCFGSYARSCEGVDALVRRQWRAIWPNIARFDFELGSVRSAASADGRWICGMVLWRSIGYTPAGRAFTRRGRMTVVLSRTRRTSPWRAVHTHYSLMPGTPNRTRRPTRRSA